MNKPVVGSLVRMLGGGPVLTVTEHVYRSELEVVCKWFSIDGLLQTAVFSSTILEPVNPGHPFRTVSTNIR